MPAGRSIVPTIAFDEADIGPDMLALNPGERAWVYHKVEFGLNNMEAARAAGYSASSDDALKSAGYNISQRPRVQAAILEMSRRVMRTEGPKCIKTLVEIRDNKTASNKDRIAATKELLDRSGFQAKTEHQVNVIHELSESQLDQRILALAAELGLTEDMARKMLISPADMKANAQIVDAEFEEVQPEISAEEQARRDLENEQRRAVRAMSPEERAAHKAQQRAEKSQAAKAKRAAAEAQRFLASGREGLEDLLD